MENRLQKLEPSKPKNISGPPWKEQPFPSNVVPITKVIENGTKIPFEVIVNKEDYKRPAYEEHWYSTTTTQSGDEIDYSLISYIPPDFWLKQKEKLNERKR